MAKKKVIVIGAGFAGLSAASFMAKNGWDVTVIERHTQPGGRARTFTEQGFTFDMGPSWYWMPDVFDRYFEKFGKRTSDYYTLKRLDPSYTLFFDKEKMDIPAGVAAIKALFESFETGSANKLESFLKGAAYKYKVGVNKLVYKPSQSILEFLDLSLLVGLFRLDVFSSVKSHVERRFRSPYIRMMLQFPVLFLGALPKNIPALYTLMNYADMQGGTWYPMGGMGKIAEAMHKLAVELGVKFRFGEEVKEFTFINQQIKSVKTINIPSLDKVQNIYSTDLVICGADYHHVEKHLLPKVYQTYSNKYWESRVMAPSSLIYYIGLSKKIEGITHHSLFFDTPFDKHGEEIYKTKKWPENPMFYVSATSVTDDKVSPIGMENLFILIPVASGLTGDDESLRNKYLGMVIDRMEKRFGQSIKANIVYSKSFACSDFSKEYHSFKGNAYGLANTLSQTALLKPSCRSKKIANLFYTGQLTVPGPGIPPSLISGEVVANLANKHFGK